MSVGTELDLTGDAHEEQAIIILWLEKRYLIEGDGRGKP